MGTDNVKPNRTGDNEPFPIREVIGFLSIVTRTDDGGAEFLNGLMVLPNRETTQNAAPAIEKVGSWS